MTPVKHQKFKYSNPEHIIAHLVMQLLSASGSFVTNRQLHQKDTAVSSTAMISKEASLAAAIEIRNSQNHINSAIHMAGSSEIKSTQHYEIMISNPERHTVDFFSVLEPFD